MGLKSLVLDNPNPSENVANKKVGSKHSKYI